jgi:DNA-binding MarR family transcriptional regulator
MTTITRAAAALNDTQVCIAALASRRTAAKLDAITRLALRGHGLTVAEYQLLVALVEVPGHSCRAMLLAPKLGVTTGGVSKLVDRAVLRGLVTRGAVEGDARGTQITITPHGGDLLAAAVPALAAALRTHLAEVTR